MMHAMRSSESAVLPAKATEGSAGMDLHALLEHPVEISPRAHVMVPTGLAVELPEPGFAAFIYARSGLACKHGIALSNGVGVIDSDYRGEIKVSLVNLSDTAYILRPGERIAQMVIQPVCLPEIIESGELMETARGEGGFGSTGDF